MKSVGMLSVLLICSILVQDSAGWLFWRRRRRLPPPPPPPPPQPRCECRITCHTNSVCYVGGCCINPGGKKLSVTARQIDVADTGDITVGFPADFTLYDENRDHFITLPEFRYALRSHLDNLANPDYLDVVFTEADANGDGKLDEDEFIMAPWGFADEEDLEKLSDMI